MQVLLAASHNNTIDLFLRPGIFQWLCLYYLQMDEGTYPNNPSAAALREIEYSALILNQNQSHPPRNTQPVVKVLINYSPAGPLHNKFIENPSSLNEWPK